MHDRAGQVQHAHTMRERIQQNKKADCPLGIRTGVWLIVFGSVLVSVLTINLSRHHTSQPTRDTASEALPDLDSSTHRPSFRRTAHREFTPAAYESGPSDDIGEAHLTMIEQMTQDRRTWMDSSE